MMRVLKMPTSFFGLYPSGALHQNACDDLEAVGDPMLDFLEKDRLLANKSVLLTRFISGKCHVGKREKESDAGAVPIRELAGVHHQAPWGVAGVVATSNLFASEKAAY